MEQRIEITKRLPDDGRYLLGISTKWGTKICIAISNFEAEGTDMLEEAKRYSAMVKQPLK